MELSTVLILKNLLHPAVLLVSLFIAFIVHAYLRFFAQTNDLLKTSEL